MAVRPTTSSPGRADRWRRAADPDTGDGPGVVTGADRTSPGGTRGSGAHQDRAWPVRASGLRILPRTSADPRTASTYPGHWPARKAPVRWCSRPTVGLWVGTRRRRRSWWRSATPTWPPPPNAVPALLPPPPGRAGGHRRPHRGRRPASPGTSARCRHCPRGEGWLLAELGGESTAALVPAAAALVAGAQAIDSPCHHRSRQAAALWRIREDGAGLAARTPSGAPAQRGLGGLGRTARTARRLPARVRGAARLV